jgi:hypothetical protein
MLKPRPKEHWKEILFNVKPRRNRYAVSSHGRVASFRHEFMLGSLLRGTLNNGYLSLKIKPGGRDLQLMIHRLVANAFLQKKSSRQDFVIHLNFDKTDNRSGNLRWASRQDVEKHQRKNPRVVRSRRARKTVGHKLDIGKVKSIKRRIRRPDGMTMKTLARRYGISLMQLYRIKRGENWGHVKA